jgi:hypothetical protein
MSWSKHFPDQIRLPDGRVIRTLREAGNYIIQLPEPERLQQHWQLATEMLIKAAEGRDLVIHAQIAMLKALGHGKAPPKKVRRTRAYKIIH